MNFLRRSSPNKEEHILCCEDTENLNTRNVLITLQDMKDQLIYETVDKDIKEIYCKMTPQVRRNIIEADKRLKSYGKNIPEEMCFDEYGNILPTELKATNGKGIILEIVQPEVYGDFYLELKVQEANSWDDILPF